MVAGDRISGVFSRLKREDCSRTKHDCEFSKWEILIGPSDWEDYSLGKEGAERYRVHNLPKSSGPGVYELGIAVFRTSLGREIDKLDTDRIVVVYLGQADSVRTRLQRYGRSGSHLGNNNSSIGLPNQKGPGLFEDILSRGYPIVFRWASMQSKSDAVKTETRLLNTFDYAWNLSDNGTRRPDEVLQRLKKISSSSTANFADIARKIVLFGPKKVGISIKADDKDERSHNIFTRVFKFGRSQPRLVQDTTSALHDNSTITTICGVVSGRGSVCQTLPAEGKKRCSEHKGMKIKKGSEQIRPIAVDYTSVCGFVSGDGSPCGSEPVRGNKRCVEHKGMRVTKEKSAYVLDLEPIDQAFRNGSKNGRCETLCGVVLGNGLVCTEQPVLGRVRCEKHKGMRVNRFTSKS